MSERTDDEKTMIALKAVHAISKEAATLWEQGHKKAAGFMLDYLVTADTESLVRFYDILDQFKGPVEE